MFCAYDRKNIKYDNDGCNENYYDNFDDNDDKNDQINIHISRVLDKKLPILGTITWSKKGQTIRAMPEKKTFFWWRYRKVLQHIDKK